MYFKCLDNGIFGSNSYVVWNKGSKDALLIDAGAETQSIMDVLDSQNLVLKKILLTHYHFDHIYHLNELKSLTHAPILIHKQDAPGLLDPDLNGSAHFAQAMTFCAADVLLEHNDTIEVAGLSFKILHTPGHTPGGICIVVENIIFTGDTLFKNSIGRTDLYGALPQAIVPSIREHLFPLPKEMKIYPGHGPSSTLEHETQHNPFCKL
jgi:hydroxyacylglutathione hydrolase